MIRTNKLHTILLYHVDIKRIATLISLGELKTVKSTEFYLIILYFKHYLQEYYTLGTV